MRILAFGDSITYGVGDSQGGWADRLKHELQQTSGHQLFNLGISGDTSRGLLTRLDAEIKARDQGDSLILIAVGVNDSRSVDSEDSYLVAPKEFRENVINIVHRAKQYTAKILVVGLTPVTKDALPHKTSCYFNSRISSYNDELAEIAQSEKLPMADLFRYMHTKEVGAYFIEDGLHPNASGYQLMLDKIRPQITSFFD